MKRKNTPKISPQIINSIKRQVNKNFILNKPLSVAEIQNQIETKFKITVSNQTVRNSLIKHNLLQKKLAPMKKEKFFVLIRKDIPLKTRNKLWEHYIKNQQINSRNTLNAITLIIASNKIFSEKNKSLRQISTEMKKKGIKISSTALLYINKLLEIRPKKELREMQKKGGKQKGGKIKILSQKEKQQIQKLKNQGKTPSEIAKIMNRSYGTVLKYYLP